MKRILPLTLLAGAVIALGACATLQRGPVGNGCDVLIEGEGADAEEAVAALADLVVRKFDEDQ